jgi:SAM-dependent methyltransferase
MPPNRAPNRTLDLAELERPAFRRIVEELEAMLATEPGAYLHPSKRWEYPWALEQARLAPGSRILDAGAGASIFPVYLAREGHRVTALDLDARRALGGGHGVVVPYVRGDLTALPFADESFDAVFCISVVEHLPEQAVPAALRELRRALRPGGKLLLTTDFFEDAAAELWYEGEDRRFRVDWHIFDEPRLRRLILGAPGWSPDGEIDLAVDWKSMTPAMRRFHGYPYTAVGIALVRGEER